MTRWVAMWIGAAALVAMAGPAMAHSEASGVAGGFMAGLQHPVGGLDHLLAMAAVGVWGAFLGRPLIWALPVAFPLMMVVGAVVGLAGLAVPHVEIGIAASVLALGVAILAAWRAPVPAALAVVGAFALFHGYAHGAELPHAADPAAYSAGFVLSTGLIHLAGIAIGMLKHLPHGGLALRATGGAIAAIGAYLLAGAHGLV